MERELWRIISDKITKLDRRVCKNRHTHSVGRIVRVYLWAVLHDRPIYWACRRSHWAGVRPPVGLPDCSTMSRRLRTPAIRAFLDAVGEELSEGATEGLIKRIDGKPLPISRHSIDGDATFGHGAGGMDRGYKVHALWGCGPMPIAWQVHSLNVSEKVVAEWLVGKLSGGGYVLADGYYDKGSLYDHVARHNHQLVVPRQKMGAGFGHRRQSPHRLRSVQLLEDPSPFGRALYAHRRQIETDFAGLTSFGGGLVSLPPWVRGRHRVTLYVHAKLIINAARLQRPAIQARRVA